ncbi:MAG: rRNA maturation RNase YbeY [Patescibacteria group bacterium]|jgi:probable rRNA maturation factor
MLVVECEAPFLSEKVFKKTLKQVSSFLRLKKKVGVSLAFVSPTVIRRLNREYRGVDKVTDVLSFPFNDPSMAGEVVICLDRAKKQGRQYSHSTEDEVVILLVHGLLHLFSFDHMKKTEAEKMFTLQQKILKSLKIDWSIPEYG